MIPKWIKGNFLLLLVLVFPFAQAAETENPNPEESTLDDPEIIDSSEILSPAESGNPLSANEDEWRFSVAFPMLWAPDINGKVRGGKDLDFSVSFKDILDSLSVGIMFELYANRGPYGLVVRSNYMRVEDGRSRTGLIDTNVETTLGMGVSDLLASFRVHDKVRLVAGVREIRAKVDLKLTGSRGSSTIIDEEITVTDGAKYDYLLGINFNHWFNDKWGIMLNSELALAGDNDRDSSTEFRALYHISDVNNFWFGYRFMVIGNDSVADGVDYKVDMTQHGPTLGWAFTF